MSDRQENTTVNEGTTAREITVGNLDGSPAVNENVVDVETLERCFNESIDRERSNIVDTVKDRLENASLTAIDSTITPKIELAVRSINASAGRDATSVMASSEHGEHKRVTAPFENVF